MRRFSFLRAAVFSGFLFLYVCLPGAFGSVTAQKVDLSFLTTRAEESNYEETTRYSEAVGFIEVAVAQHPLLHVTTLGYTSEGRALPLVVFGDVADASPESVRASGKLRVYVQGNIHAGEVCGKEALLMLIRDLASGQHENWADSLVLLLVPIYNADGNERVNINNRPRQNGPLAGMGQRSNAQGLDLNRDHMKVKSPEARSFIRMMKEYDPQLLVDLHTTNGSQHAYHLTYSPPLNPNTDPGISELLRERLLPAVTDSIRSHHGWEYYFYGNLPFRRNTEQGWYTFDHRPRFNNNYIGLRNRVAILSEAYAYATFRDRVLATRYFVNEIIEYSFDHVSEIEAVVAEADQRSIVGEQMAVRAEYERSDTKVNILLGETVNGKNPYSGAMIRERLDVIRTEEMYEYGSFKASETERVPATYYFEASHVAVLEYLDIHGIEFSRIEEAVTMSVESFQIDSTTVAERTFQQVNERQLYGKYVAVERVFGVGTIVVSMNQPLARLVFYLFEPRSDDGLLNWAQLDETIEKDQTYPIYRSLD